jgi:hypothetical protein
MVILPHGFGCAAAPIGWRYCELKPEGPGWLKNLLSPLMSPEGGSAGSVAEVGAFSGGSEGACSAAGIVVSGVFSGR